MVNPAKSIYLCRNMAGALDGPCFDYPLDKVEATSRQYTPVEGQFWQKETMTLNFRNENEPQNSHLRQGSAQGLFELKKNKFEPKPHNNGKSV